MLNSGIFKNYVEKRANSIAQTEVEVKGVAEKQPLSNQGIATIATTTAKAFIENPLLHQEVFGPYSLVIRCKEMNEMLQVAKHIEGQLTATFMATDDDVKNNEEQALAPVTNPIEMHNTWEKAVCDIMASKDYRVFIFP